MFENWMWFFVITFSKSFLYGRRIFLLGVGFLIWNFNQSETTASSEWGMLMSLAQLPLHFVIFRTELKLIIELKGLMNPFPRDDAVEDVLSRKNSIHLFHIRFQTDENRKNSQKQYKIPAIYHSIDNPKDSLSHICSNINRYIVKMKIIFIVYLFVF